jgi:hypothetical protein
MLEGETREHGEIFGEQSQKNSRELGSMLVGGTW